MLSFFIIISIDYANRIPSDVLCDMITEPSDALRYIRLSIVYLIVSELKTC